MKNTYPFRVLSRHTGPNRHHNQAETLDPKTILEHLGCDQGNVPFTAGSESELQAVVTGKREQVDLPLTIEHSSFFANLLRRAQAGDTSESLGSIHLKAIGAWALITPLMILTLSLFFSQILRLGGCRKPRLTINKGNKRCFATISII